VTQAPAEGAIPAVTDDEQDHSEQELVRREKLDRLKETGTDPYPVTVPRTATLAEVVGRYPDRPGHLHAQHRQALLRHAA
jgi:lysyl-tRNA synthetase class II